MAVAELKTKVPTHAELMQRAESLLPSLRERAKKTEELRRLPDETMRDLFDTGLLRILQPKRYGGYGMGWAAHADAARVLARACSSTAWIVSVVGAHAAIAGRLNKQCQDEIWGKSQDQLVATASARANGTLRKVDGGYRLSGHWRFASGVDHSEWTMVTAPIEEDGMVSTEPHFFHRALMPTKDIEIVDSWHVAGMKGTGSKDVKAHDIFIPEHRLMSAADSFGRNPPGAAVNTDSYLYHVPFMAYFGNSLLGPILGATEGAYHDYCEITRVRTSALFGSSVAEQTPVQMRLAETAAEIKAARLIYEDANAFLHQLGVKNQEITHEQKLEAERDRAYVARLCVSAVTRLVRQMGAMGLADSNPVQRHYRDVTAMATQIAVNWDRGMAPYGRMALGLPTETKYEDKKVPVKP